MKRKLAGREPSSTIQTPAIVKEEDGAFDTFSHDGKKRGSASRTGTACDRCKARKMRCDDDPDGCASCRHAQTECTTTDRITKKATVRGYVDSLEHRLLELQQRNQELRAQILSMGGQVAPDQRDNPPVPEQYCQLPNGTLPADEHVPAGPPRQVTESRSTGEVMDSGSTNGLRDGRSHLPQSRKGLGGNNYFGISSGDSLLTSVRGTAMNVLGMEIELAGYLSPDVDEPDPSRADQPIYNKSYRAFVNTAFGLGPKLAEVELPARSEGFKYAEIFLRGTMPFVPVVHKPTFMDLVFRIYDDTHFRPTIAEIAIVHSAFAIAYCQKAVRGARSLDHQRELNSAGNFHYHYALGFFPQLMASHTLADVQALVLLCIFLRNCPKPGASWMLTSIVLDLAIELGLHRSAKNWAPNVKKNMLEIEIRKRVFWSINWIHVLVGGSLGRPMALRTGDWDVEVPESVDDDLLSEQGLDISRPGKCNFLAAIQNFKILPIYIDLYNVIYAVGARPPDYEDRVRGLEGRLERWHEQWPPEIYDSTAFQSEVGMIQLQYLHMWRLHVRLLLRHPSLLPTTSAQFNSESLTICLETSRELLHHVKVMQSNRGLDITWQTSALFVLAIATSLYGRWERRSLLTPQHFRTLKEDMSDWLQIMTDMDGLLGAKGQLVRQVQSIIDKAFTDLSQHVISKAALPQRRPQACPPPLQPNAQGHSSGSQNGYQTYQHFSRTENDCQPKPPPTPFIQTINNMPLNTYPPPDYNPNIPTQNSLSSSAPAATAFLSPAYPRPSYHSNFGSPLTGDMYQTPGSPTSWRNFTCNILPQRLGSPAGEYMSSASALLQMGNTARDTVPIPDMGQRQNVYFGEAPMWPTIWFDPKASGV